MTKALIIKTSSMGDVIHTLPALTDARIAYPDIEFDWVVEPSFAEIPKWHRAVKNVIPAPLRRWRHTPWQAFKSGEWSAFVEQLRTTTYDLVIDAQGLYKSALVTRMARGRRVGPDLSSAREALASLAYQDKISVNQNQHAVVRARQLFAGALKYSLTDTPPDYGVMKDRLFPITYGDNTIIFLHGTTWVTKHWPQEYWEHLGLIAAQKGYQVLIPWGSNMEHLRAIGILEHCQDAGVEMLPIVLPKLSLGELTSLISQAKGIVAVDTGLGHIAAAMATPTISLYGPTDPVLTGAYGPKQVHLKVNYECSPCFSRECKRGDHFLVMPPCFQSLPPKKVWDALETLMETVATREKEFV
jgi:heptosyltransferase I